MSVGIYCISASSFNCGHFHIIVCVCVCMCVYVCVDMYVSLQEEAPYYTEVLSEMTQKINDLRELNQGQSIPALESAQQEIEEKFERANSLANQLSATMADFSEEQRDLQQAMHDENEWLNQLKDLLSRCDDVSGEDADIIKRLGDCKVRLSVTVCGISIFVLIFEIRQVRSRSLFNFALIYFFFYKRLFGWFLCLQNVWWTVRKKKLFCWFINHLC